jgi:NAD(P)-dependent dehydrogenase (short-subunit alcohol dehydrogenase family)
MNKVAVITGGTGGLGKAVTRYFLENDFSVIVTYYSDKELKDLLEYVADHKKKLQALRINVTDEASLDELAGQVKAKHGQVDALVCLVGGFGPGTWGHEAAESFDKLFTLNTKSFLLTCNAIIPLMQKTKKDSDATWRHIVAVAARPALEPTKGIGIYAASKAALASLVQTLAIELLDDRVTVNAIAPSTIDTAANRKAMSKADPKKWVKPEQIAQTIYYLASDQSNATSGAIVPVYGRA